MNNIEDINFEAFNAILNSSNHFVLEFWVRSCGFCQKFKSVYKQLPSIFKEVKFYRMNMLKSTGNLRLAERMGVEQTPTTKIFFKGKELGEIVGFKTLDETKKLLSGMIKSSQERSN